MKRTKYLALLGAAVLSVGTVSMALAIELKEAHQGVTVSWDENGAPTNDGDIEFLETCDGVTPAQGEVIFHFVQSGNDVSAGAAGTNLLDVDFNDEADVNDVPEDSIQGNGSNVDWYVSVDASDGAVTVVTANSNLDGGDLRISHICAGDEPDEEESEAPSFEASQAAETDEPEFSGDEGGLTEPPTDTLSGNGTSSPADSAWLLVVALGVLLASIVVLTPARAKSRR